MYFIYLFKNKQKCLIQTLKKIQTSKFLEICWQLDHRMYSWLPLVPTWREYIWKYNVSSSFLFETFIFLIL